MARILVLDEHGVYRAGLCALISTQMPQAQVLSAKSLIEALPQIQTGVFDLVLLGLDLSDSETADTLMGAREASAATRFVIISASDTRGDILAALAACRTRRASNLQLIEFVELSFLIEKSQVQQNQWVMV
jgi:DNA-binding NarL/FixJ family response regulator